MNSIPLTIKETQEGIFTKKFSTFEIVESYLDRIEKLNHDLNIFLTVTGSNAKNKAKEIDESIHRYKSIEEIKKDHPLFGVVGSYKDIFLTKGVKTTAGSKVLENYIPQYSSTVVERLESAGVVSLGKLNLDAWAHGSSGENSDFGTTKNPWNSEYVPGGSSSGSGAALAANLSLITTATDTCGSTRLPANYCGVVGLKPTYGAVSRYGVVAMASSLDSIGHMTRTVGDSEAVFNVTKGEDGKDATVKNPKLQDSKTPSKIKIGIPKEFFSEGLDSEIGKMIDEVMNIYKKDGVEFVEVSLPHTKYGVDAYYIIQPAEVSSNLGRYDGVRYGNSRDLLGEEAKRRIMLGTYVLSAGYYDAYYLKAMKVRSVIIKELDQVFEKVDALIAPVAPTPPFKIGEKVDDPLQMYLTDIYAATANLSGIPALALPFGFSKNNLPLGFQLMAPRFAEGTLFHLGKRFEKLTDYVPMVALP